MSLVNFSDVVPESVARANDVVPMGTIGTTLVLAGTAKFSDADKEDLEFVLNRRIRIVIRSSDWIQARQAMIYSCLESDEAASTDPVTWYWPDWHAFEDDGTLKVKCSGWRSDNVHWNGMHEFPPNHADYAFWRWVVGCKFYHRLLDERELPAVRRVWNRYQVRCTTHP
jgi:hypothetical protein